jgi:hypothetical protein
MRPAWISAMAPGTSMKGAWGIVGRNLSVLHEGCRVERLRCKDWLSGLAGIA